MAAGDPKDGSGHGRSKDGAAEPKARDSAIAQFGGAHDDVLRALEQHAGAELPEAGTDEMELIAETTISGPMPALPARGAPGPAGSLPPPLPDEPGTDEIPTLREPGPPSGEGLSAFQRAGSEDLTYGDIVWGQFRKNPTARFSLGFLAFLLSLAVGAPLLSSSRPFYWQSLPDGTRWPWLPSLFDRNFFENPVDVFWNLLLVLGVPLLGLFLWRLRSIRAMGLPKRPRRRRIQREAALLLLGLALVYVGLIARPYSTAYVLYPSLLAQAEEKGEAVSAVFPPVRYTPRETGFKSLEKPSREHILGVDQSTRDVAVRLLYGTRISLTIGVIAVAIYVLIGVTLGATAGYFGGRVDLVIQRLIEIMMSVPTFFVILTLVAFIEHPSIFHIMLIIGLVNWTGVARLVRAEFLRLRNLDFVMAAVALGYPTRRIIFEQVLPNAMGPVLVSATFGVAVAILVESTLSFLGLGDLSAPSWGQTLQEGYATGAWHLILAPGIAIFVTVSALNLVGEGLRDALDPKLRQ
jgi:peptide/nickel transport system permease protein